jgi:dTDP-4-amino-4,6-dideoxygalactose transaminase
MPQEENYYNRGISLLMFPNLMQEEQEFVIKK